MSYKDILVIVDSSKKSRQRVEAAVRLAQRHEAHLVGLFVRTMPFTPEFAMGQLGPEVIDVQRKWIGELAAQARETFEAVTKPEQVSAEWREDEGYLVDQSLLHSRYADLVVMGQYDPDSDVPESQNDLVDNVVLGSGRPVLVIPYAGQVGGLGKRVLVAWNGSREATRAINDAIPFLQQAERVDVLAINPHKGTGRDGHGDIPSADICLHLARHGVKANAQHLTAHDIDVGAMLLSQAADLQSDLIVMGAYGRSRLREMVMGGATRHLLEHMTVPVLMSH